MNDTSLDHSFDYDAFISYATADSHRVTQLVASLEERGLRCWMAPRDIRPGIEYGEEIIRAIKLSKSLVVFISAVSVKSRHVRAEVERAVTDNKTVYPARIEDVEVGEALEFFLSIRQFVDLFDDPTEATVKRLADAISSDAPLEQIAKYSRRSLPKWVFPSAVAGVVLFGLMFVYQMAASKIARQGIERQTQDAVEQLRQFRDQSAQITHNSLDDISVSSDFRGDGIRLQFTGARERLRGERFEVSLNDGDFESLDQSNRPVIRNLDSVLIRSKESGETRELADTIIDTVAEQLGKRLERTGDNWDCSLGGCMARQYSNALTVCNPMVSRIDLKQEGMSEWVRLPESDCAVKDPASVTACLNYSSFPTSILPGADFRARYTLFNGSNTEVNIELDRSPFTRARVGGSVDDWVVMEPLVDRNPKGVHPLAIVGFQPAKTAVGGYKILSGLEACDPRETKSTQNQYEQNTWLMDEDGKGLVRVESRGGLQFGPLQYEEIRPEQRPSLNRLISGPSVVGIALQKPNGERLGPYWYTFDARDPVQKAAKRAGMPQVKCGVGDRYRRTETKNVCEPVDRIAWIGADQVAFGVAPANLDVIYDLDYSVETYMTETCNSKTVECAPFRFAVPDDWSDVYYRITYSGGKRGALERVQLHQ